jgi:peroxiredoxin
MHIFKPPKSNQRRPDHSQPLDETFDPSKDDTGINDISMISRNDAQMNETIGDTTTMMFDIDLISDSKISNVDRQLRK